MKLFRVTLRGLYATKYGASYVVAPDPTTAYQMVRAKLDDKDYGFDKDRELHSIELLADSGYLHDSPSQLFLPTEIP
jgi:hypothetical protein